MDQTEVQQKPRGKPPNGSRKELLRLIVIAFAIPVVLVYFPSVPYFVQYGVFVLAIVLIIGYWLYQEAR